ATSSGSASARHVDRRWNTMIGAYGSMLKRVTLPSTTSAASRSVLVVSCQRYGATSRHFFGAPPAPSAMATLIVPSLFAATLTGPSRLTSDMKLLSGRRLLV